MPFKSEKQRKWMHANKPKMAKKWEKEEKSVEEDRDYKAEYKKFQSSDKAKKYRSELNQYNRKKGTYGNGDGKDASHKGGKIVGFESQSKNRGRAEKSRLKKEAISKDEWAQYPKYARKLKPYMKKLLKVPVRVRVIKQANHNPWIEVRVARFGKDIIPNDFRKKALKAIGGGRPRDMDNITYGNISAGSISMKHDQWVKLLGNKVKSESINEAGGVITARIQQKPRGYWAVFNKKGQSQFEGNKKFMINILKKASTLSPNAIGSILDRARFGDKHLEFKAQFSRYYFNESINESGILYKAGVKKYGKEGMAKILSAAGKRKSHAEIGKIKDKYEKKKKESVKESDLGMLERSGDYGWDWKNLTVKKGKTVKVTHKTSGKSLIIIDKPNVKKEYEKIGYFAESVNEAAIAGSQIVKASTSKLVKIYKQMADERLSSGAALTFRLIAKELIKRKAKLEGGKDCCDNCKEGKPCCSVESVKRRFSESHMKGGGMSKVNLVNESTKRQYRDVYSKYYKTYEAFAREVMNLTKRISKISGDKVDAKIILKNFKKHVIPFAGLMNSWSKGRESNPHIDEGFGSPELMGKKDLAEFEKTRQKNAEVLGYKLTGQTDIKPIKEKSKVTK
jgi:hypothetical protein